MTEPTDFDDEDFISKSSIKRDMHRLQDLGAKILSLKLSDQKKFNLGDELVTALEEDKRIKSHEAKRRHLQYIGKLMRNENLDEVQRSLDKLDPSSDFYLRVQNQAEAWRLKLLRNTDAEGQWFKQYPTTERQSFRAMVRAARKEQPEDAETLIGGKNTKKLLQFLKQTLMS